MGHRCVWLIILICYQWLYNQTLADARSTGAGSESLYFMLLYCLPFICISLSAPSAPVNLTSSPETPCSITITWIPPVHQHGPIERYRVYHKENLTDTDGRGSTDIISNSRNKYPPTRPISYTMNGLKPNTSYTFRVSEFLFIDLVMIQLLHLVLDE